MSDTLVNIVVAHGKHHPKCQRTGREVMLSYMAEGDDSLAGIKHDLFLTRKQAEQLLVDLKSALHPIAEAASPPAVAAAKGLKPWQVKR